MRTMGVFKLIDVIIRERELEKVPLSLSLFNNYVRKEFFSVPNSFARESFSLTHFIIKVKKMLERRSRSFHSLPFARNYSNLMAKHKNKRR